MATVRGKEILKQEDFQRVQDGIQAAETAVELAELAIRAGMPAEQHLEKAQKTRDGLLRIKGVFFAGQ